ncbi:MAG TPA: hypothetical protein VMH40_01770 [Myxococcaceae bacterium]|nr:hypothetical protein [Myxococcaceae bacterium]
MRLVLLLLCTTTLLAGCKRQAQEAVAEAKGAAADAQRAARDAAAQARSAADQAKAAADDAAAKARAAADDATARARAAADQARGAASSATESARHGLDSAGQSLHELTEGDQVSGVLVGSNGSLLDVRPGSGPVQTIGTDAQTRWVLRGAAAGRDGFPIGSSVRVTYIVKSGEKVATQVEAVPH